MNNLLRCSCSPSHELSLGMLFSQSLTPAEKYAGECLTEGLQDVTVSQKSFIPMFKTPNYKKLQCSANTHPVFVFTLSLHPNVKSISQQLLCQ